MHGSIALVVISAALQSSSPLPIWAPGWSGAVVSTGHWVGHACGELVGCVLGWLGWPWPRGWFAVGFAVASLVGRRGGGRVAGMTPMVGRADRKKQNSSVPRLGRRRLGLSDADPCWGAGSAAGPAGGRGCVEAGSVGLAVVGGSQVGKLLRVGRQGGGRWPRGQFSIEKKGLGTDCSGADVCGPISTCGGSTGTWGGST